MSCIYYWIVHICLLCDTERYETRTRSVAISGPGTRPAAHTQQGGTSSQTHTPATNWQGQSHTCEQRTAFRASGGWETLNFTKSKRLQTTQKSTYQPLYCTVYGFIIVVVHILICQWICKETLASLTARGLVSLFWETHYKRRCSHMNITREPGINLGIASTSPKSRIWTLVGWFHHE